jgi:hypothetical protein
LDKTGGSDKEFSDFANRFPTPVLSGSGIGGIFSDGFAAATPNGQFYM